MYAGKHPTPKFPAKLTRRTRKPRLARRPGSPKSALNVLCSMTRPEGVLGSGWRGREPGTLRTAPAGVSGRCESANLSQRVAISLLHSQCERLSGTLRIGESVPATRPESVRAALGLRSNVNRQEEPWRFLINEASLRTTSRGFRFFAVVSMGLQRSCRCKPKSPLVAVAYGYRQQPQGWPKGPVSLRFCERRMGRESGERLTAFYFLSKS